MQFNNGDPLIYQYQLAQYPVRKLRTYNATTIVGFPTAPTISTLGMGDALVTAVEASPEDQYRWLQLGEKYWLEGDYPSRANQISFTLKYDPKKLIINRLQIC